MTPPYFFCLLRTKLLEFNQDLCFYHGPMLQKIRALPDNENTLRIPLSYTLLEIGLQTAASLDSCPN